MGSKKRKVKAAPEPTQVGPRVVSFDEMLESFTATVTSLVRSLKGRTGGAAEFGADGLFVCAVESLHTARGARNLEDFLKSAAYSVSAALAACGAWEYPPRPAEDQAEPETEPKTPAENEGEDAGP